MRKTLLYLTLSLALLAGLWTAVGTQTGTNWLTMSIMSRGVVTVNAKTPLKIGTDYTLSNPAVAPTDTTGAFGSCLNTEVYRLYTAWAGLGGISLLSPASTDFTPSSNNKRITVTRSETVPSGALGWIVYWSKASEGGGAHSVKRYCNAGTPTTAVGSGVSTFDCNCSGTGDAHGGTNTTGFKALTTVNSLANNFIGMGTVGTTIGSATENNRRLDLSGLSPKYSSDSGVSYFPLFLRPKIITVCNAGCDYTTLNAACATETSTAAVPITYLVLPGVITTSNVTQSCSGEDSASFIGYGAGVSVIDCGTSNCLALGTSLNITVQGLTLKGNRGIDWTLNGTGGGKSAIIDNELISNNSGGTAEDCLLYGSIGGGGAVAGSVLRIARNRCGYITDGFTVADDANTEVYSHDNTFYHSAAPYGSRHGGWSLFSIPCIFESSGDTFNLDSTPSAAHSGAGLGNNAYLFDGSLTLSCATPTSLKIQAASVYINDKTANGTNADANAIRVASTATEAALIEVSGSSFNVNMPNDSGNGNSRGIDVANATTAVAIYGTRIRTTGGQAGTRLALDGNVVGSILVGPDTDWLTDDGNLTGREVKCMNIDPASTVTDWLFWRTDRGVTVKHVRCIVDAATSVVMTLRECNGDGGSCGATEAAITCATTTTSEASAIDDPTVAANVWMRVLRGTVTGTPTQAALCMEYTTP